jgi:ubiquinone/menaquinone biosynthesis C-methylase UbiE
VRNAPLESTGGNHSAMTSPTGGFRAGRYAASDCSGGFSEIDRAARPEAFVQFMDDANTMPFFQATKEQTYARLALQPGDRVLDIGCGAGTDVRALASIVGPGGMAVGIDGSATMIAAARERSEGSGLPVEFLVCDAHQLDFPDASFDGCRTDRVLLHLADPARVIREIARVLRPGGRAVCLEPDGGGMLVDAVDRDTTTRILEHRSRAVRSGWIGRSLPRLFRAAGLTDVQVQVLPSPRFDFEETNTSLRLFQHADGAAAAGAITVEAAKRWKASLLEAAARDDFFCLVTMFLVVGRKP